VVAAAGAVGGLASRQFVGMQAGFYEQHSLPSRDHSARTHNYSPKPSSQSHALDMRARYDKFSNGKGSPYSIAERRVPELMPVLGSQPARDVSHKPGGRLLLLFARPAVTPATLKRAATYFTAW